MTKTNYAHTHRIQVPHVQDDAFNYDVAILDIIVVGMNARVLEYTQDYNEYFIIIDDRQLTVLTLKGYKISRRLD